MVRAEADGLRCVPTWDEDNPRDFEDVRNKSTKSGVKVHFGKLMTIASMKCYELAKHLRKMKGRIVYRGDCAKDEEGALAQTWRLSGSCDMIRKVTWARPCPPIILLRRASLTEVLDKYSTYGF